MLNVKYVKHLASEIDANKHPMKKCTNLTLIMRIIHRLKQIDLISLVPLYGTIALYHHSMHLVAIIYS